MWQSIASVWFLVVFVFWAIKGLVFMSQWNILQSGRARFASSLRALCSWHVDPPELLNLADSSPMHGRNVALVAAMNTPITFCNANYVQKKWVLNIMTAELSINTIKYAVILSYSPVGGVDSSGGNGKTTMSRGWVNCLSLWHFCRNSESLGQNSGVSCYNSD